MKKIAQIVNEGDGHAVDLANHKEMITAVDCNWPNKAFHANDESDGCSTSWINGYGKFMSIL